MAEAKPKFTAAQVKEHIKNIQAEIEKQRKALKKDRIFVGITPEEIEEKLKRVNSPMITGIAWNNSSPGGWVHVDVTIYNPDPTTARGLYVHYWVGTGNIDPNLGTFLLNVDTRFPRLTQPAYAGLTVNSRASRTLADIAFRVPVEIEHSAYIGNVCLMIVNITDVGMYLDRGSFPFRVPL